MFYATQIIGRRECQEDSYAIEEVEAISTHESEFMQVFVVADGMGGHSSGEIASRIAVDTFMQSVKCSESNEPWSSQSLINALIAADTAIAEAMDQDGSLAGMGTTLLGVTRRADTLEWVSVGDSPLLLFRDFKLEQLNDDHSMLPVLVESLEAKGQSRTLAKSDPRRHRLRSALIGSVPKLVDTGTLELRSKDIVLMASDGLETLDTFELNRTLTENYEKDPEAIATTIIDKIQEREAFKQDNATLIVYRHG